MNCICGFINVYEYILEFFLFLFQKLFKNCVKIGDSNLLLSGGDFFFVVNLVRVIEDRLELFVFDLVDVILYKLFFDIVSYVEKFVSKSEVKFIKRREKQLEEEVKIFINKKI